MARTTTQVLVVTISLGTWCAMSPAAAQMDDPYRITAAEKAACGADAERYCTSAFPDEHALLLCLRSNQSRLSQTCLPVFEAGLRRRGL